MYVYVLIAFWFYFCLSCDSKGKSLVLMKRKEVGRGWVFLGVSFIRKHLLIKSLKDKIGILDTWIFSLLFWNLITLISKNSIYG